MEKLPDCFEQLRGMTAKLLQLARAEEWDEVARLEIERRPLLRSIFDPSSQDIQTPPYQDLLREILQADQELMGLAAARRDYLRDQLQAVTQGRTAVRAYQQQP